MNDFFISHISWYYKFEQISLLFKQISKGTEPQWFGRKTGIVSYNVSLIFIRHDLLIELPIL